MPGYYAEAVETAAVIAIIVVTVLTGTVLQRLSGTGVGLVVAPVLSLILGPGFGVFTTNMTTVISGLLIMLVVWRYINWRAYLLIGPAAVVGAWPAAWLVGALPTAWLSILLGTLVVGALLLTFFARKIPEWKSPAAAVTAGFFGGFFNTTSGVAAPVMVIYSRLSRWDQTGFSATLQPVFMTMGIASVVSKLVMGTVDPSEAGTLPLALLLLVVPCSVGFGLVIATPLTRVVTAAIARRLAMMLAAIGGVGAIVRGALDLIL